MPSTDAATTQKLTLIAADTALTTSYQYSSYVTTLGLKNGSIHVTVATAEITSLELRFDEKATTAESGMGLTVSDLDTTTGIETLYPHSVTLTKANIDTIQTASGGGFSYRIPITAALFRVGVKGTGTMTSATVKIEAEVVE